MNFKRNSRMQIDLFSVNDKNGLDRVYVLLNSVKKTKLPDTTIHYRLIIEGVDDSIKQYFSDLQSEDFKIEYFDTEWFKQRINVPTEGLYCSSNYYTMVRCLCPSYFKQLDKVLYLDTDIVLLQRGIEELWETDITDYYMAGCEDIIVTRFERLQCQRVNSKNRTSYINGGVILFNFKLIREAGLDVVLAKWCQNWNYEQLKPYYLDQTLLNYICRDKIKYVDYKFNDISLVTSVVVYKLQQQYLKQKYGYPYPVNSINDAVILHFLGDGKPWREVNQRVYPYYPVAKQVWKAIQKELKKNEEAKEV